MGSSAKPILITAPVGNNPARCRMLIYHKGLEDSIEMKSPADYGGLASAEYRKINPQGKMPALILPSGETVFEAKVVLQYINDKPDEDFTRDPRTVTVRRRGGRPGIN